MTPYPYRNVQSGHAEGLTLTSRHVVVIGVGHREAIITWLRICIMRVDLYCRCAGYRAALPSSLTIRCHYASGNECVLAAVLTRPSRLAKVHTAWEMNGCTVWLDDTPLGASFHFMVLEALAVQFGARDAYSRILF